MIDLHIHTIHSDGELNVSSNDSFMLSNYSLVAITDHENIFDPAEFRIRNSAKFISGVEICCNYEGQPIEILGYNFDAKNTGLVNLVDRIKELRINAIRKILNTNGIRINNLPVNPFRINVQLPDGVDTRKFWQQHNFEYRAICHSVPATDVISAIIAAGGIPVLAHPMESLTNKSENDIERFILSMGIRTVELITPKHSKEDVVLLRRIIDRNNLAGSIGSDSHKSVLTKISHEYSINEQIFEWIRDLVSC